MTTILASAAPHDDQRPRLKAQSDWMSASTASARNSPPGGAAATTGRPDRRWRNVWRNFRRNPLRNPVWIWSEHGCSIRHSLVLVGAVPIAAAAAIAVAALFLLNQVDRARSGAVIAGTIYRNAIVASNARDRYLMVLPQNRTLSAGQFDKATRDVDADLSKLASIVSQPAHVEAVDDARFALAHLVASMDRLVAITERTDGQLADMSTRAEQLIKLADEARSRQQASNIDIAASLADNDKRLRKAREIVNRAYAVRAVVADLKTMRSRGIVGGSGLALETLRLSNTSRDLEEALEASAETPERIELAGLVAAYLDEVRGGAGFGPGSPLVGSVIDGTTRRVSSVRLTEWLDTLLKINITESTAVHDQMAELLTYSVLASETDQSTQAIATGMLKLGEQTARALAARDLAGIEQAVDSSRALSERIAALPISPLIQTEMLDASTGWRRALTSTSVDIDRQNALVLDMNEAAQTMVASVQTLNDLLTGHAVMIGDLIRKLLIGAALLALLLAGTTGLLAASSITRPLGRLQREMRGLVDGTHHGPIAGTGRRDELGDMARATKFFVTEIRRRERALQQANEAANAALDDLHCMQADLIQAEKLASLGQLVAGVAHEINTPLGVALTTATVMGPEVERFEQIAADNQLSRSALNRFTERMADGARLLTANLTRAADLVNSFKQVAADQASGERRRFNVRKWLDDLLTSLGPALRKAGHQVDVVCPLDLEIDSYPGALAQVVTNLVVNSITHGYAPGISGRLSLAVQTLGDHQLHVVYADNGKGIPPENRSRVFDPFFTTGRGCGSTGLGLHIVFNIVTGRLGGRIDLDAAPGGGARFTIELPTSAPDDGQTRQPDAPCPTEPA